MTIIAWDGKTLAADKLACGSFKHNVTKITRESVFYEYRRTVLVGAAGPLDAASDLISWFIKDRTIDKFPQMQRSENDWASLLVIMDNGWIHRYDRSPISIKIPPQRYAMGSGCDFAMAAMYLGKTAEEAVKVACELDPSCGGGVDTLSFL
jgi:hypothetical protein